MKSHRNTFVQRLKDLISEPTPRQINHLIGQIGLDDDPVPTQPETVPLPLVNALRSPTRAPQVIAFTVEDVTVRAVVYPIAEINYRRESEVWGSIRDGLPQWQRLGDRAHRMARERLEPEIAALRLPGIAGEEVTVTNLDLPYKPGIAALLRPPIIFPAAFAGGAHLVGRTLRRPAAVGIVSAVAAAGLTAGAALIIIDGDTMPDARPAPAYTVFLPRPGPTLTVTAAPGSPSPHAASPSPELTGPAARTTGPSILVSPSDPPRLAPTPGGRPRPRPVPTRVPTRVPAPSPTSTPEDTPSRSSVPSSPPTVRPPTSAPAGAEQPEPSAEPTQPPQAKGCAILDIRVPVGKLADVNVCLG